MVHLRSLKDEALDIDFAPIYMTEFSACADLFTREDFVLVPNAHHKAPTGVWIERIDWEKIPAGCIPELQIRCRSGLAFKHGIMLTNGVGTVDLDYPDEICVLLSNFGGAPVQFKKGDRIAQIGLNFLHRFPDLNVGGARRGGFGSTSK